MTLFDSLNKRKPEFKSHSPLIVRNKQKSLKDVRLQFLKKKKT